MQKRGGGKKKISRFSAYAGTHTTSQKTNMNFRKRRREVFNIFVVTRRFGASGT